MLALALSAVLAQSPVLDVPDAGAEPKHEWTLELSTLELLHGRGVLNDAEFESAVKDLRDSVGMKAPDKMTLVASKFALTMYGFIQVNAIYDTTQSFAEQIGNGGCW